MATEDDTNGLIDEGLQDDELPEEEGDPLSPLAEHSGEDTPEEEEFDCSEWVGEGEPWTQREGRFTKYKGSINILHLPESSCAEGHHSTWKLRCKGYAKTRKKAISHHPMYSFVGCDLLSSPDPFTNASSLGKLPPPPDFPTNGLPHTLVALLHLPRCEKPGMFSQNPGGKTVTAVVVFSLKEEWAMKAGDEGEVQELPQVKLLQRFCEKLGPEPIKASTDPFLGRMKLLVKSETGVPSSFSKFNGKPVLITSSGAFSLNNGVLEVSINMRAWAYPARLALYSNWNKLVNYKLHVGLCIEGRTDEELPEALLGACMISQPTQLMAC